MKKTILILFTFICSFNTIAQWTDVSNSSVTSTLLFAVSQASEDTMFATGSSGTIIRSIDKGSNWTSQTSGITTTLNDIEFINSLIGIAVGDGGVIRRTTNGGGTWSAVTSGVTSKIYAVQFIDATTGFLAGESGVIKKSVNSGASWSTITSPTSDKIQDINFLNSQIGYIVGDNNTVYYTSNGGTNWTSQTVPFANNNSLSKVQALDNTNAISVGPVNRIMNTSNNGTSWADKSKSTASYYKSLSFINKDIGYVVGANGVVLYTSDNCNTFTTHTTPITDPLFDVEVSPCGFAIAVGNSGAIIIKNDESVSATNDSYITKEDSAITINKANGILKNDVITSIFPSIVTLISDASNGSLTLNDDGSFDYTPNGSFVGIDTFTYSVEAGCNTSSIVEVIITVEKADEVKSIAESIHSISVFPNPAYDNIRINSTSKINNVKITNMLGEVVYSNNYTSKSINISDLSKGIYNIEVTFIDGYVLTNNKIIKK